MPCTPIAFEMTRLPIYGVDFVAETIARVRHDDDATIEPFVLSGGKYAARCEVAGAPVVGTLVDEDGIPHVAFAGSGADIIELPAGSYRIVVEPAAG